jgi:hypothetical protein
MREKMAEMQRQVEDFVTTMNSELASRPFVQQTREKNVLIPVLKFLPTKR